MYSEISVLRSVNKTKELAKSERQTYASHISEVTPVVRHKNKMAIGKNKIQYLVFFR